MVSFLATVYCLLTFKLYTKMSTATHKQNLLNELYAPFQKCTQCPLGTQGRKHVVFGDGNPDATLFLIGEAPGASEDAQGIPFVGRSGQLLNKALAMANIKREDLFISNIVKCRPPNNRKPLPLEINTCKKLFLLNQIRIVNPKIICVLGSTALEGLIEKKIKITQERGNCIDFNGIIIVPTYHPSYVLRNPKLLDTLIDDFKLAIKKATDL